jgi:hypothetical protein
VLKAAPGAGVRVFAIWEPIRVSDLAPPISAVLGRLPDERVRQFWDPDHAVSAQLKKDARPPQPVQECCEQNGHLWDLAAVYPAGSTWTDRLPPATLFNGPVVDLGDSLRDALTPPKR